MDTVKVDVQKLQILNDRIAQTIEALNQVRLSVHGIQHTGSAFGQSPWTGYGMPYAQQGTPFGAPGLPFAQNLPYPQTLSPLAAMGVPGIGGFGGIGGIGHTSAPVDPFWQVRLAQAVQTFPFAVYGYPPVGW